MPLPALGQRAELTRAVTDADITRFAEATGDFNPPPGWVGPRGRDRPRPVTADRDPPIQMRPYRPWPHRPRV